MNSLLAPVERFWATRGSTLTHPESPRCRVSHRGETKLSTARPWRYRGGGTGVEVPGRRPVVASKAPHSDTPRVVETAAGFPVLLLSGKPDSQGNALQGSGTPGRSPKGSFRQRHQPEDKKAGRSHDGTTGCLAVFLLVLTTSSCRALRSNQDAIRERLHGRDVIVGWLRSGPGTPDQERRRCWARGRPGRERKCPSRCRRHREG